MHGDVPLRPIEPPESLLSNNTFAPMWARACALLVASEKVAQVVELVKAARRRSLQEGVQLLIALEEDDLPQIFAICREIMRSTDEAQAVAEATSAAGVPARTIWWHQVDEEGEEVGTALHEVAMDAAASKYLKRARLQLMQGHAVEAIGALNKVRLDFVAFARDAVP